MSAASTFEPSLYQHFYINGQWVKPNGQNLIDVVDSSTEDIIAQVPEGTTMDANDAVEAARTAFESWSHTSPQVRADYLDKIAAGLKAHSETLSTLVAREVGMPLKMASRVQVGGPVANWANYAKLAREFEWQEKVGHSLVVREAAGVVAAITPWNFPLNQITLKVAAAMAAGCTVVLKPSEVAPLNAFVLAHIIHEAGVPAGVFNLVTGYGPIVGEALVAHPEVDMVSFTGSTRAGRRISEVAAATVKRVALELGGKSASVVLPSADLNAAIKGTVQNCFLNSGQTCSAQTRLLVHESQYEQAKAIAREVANSFTVGPALTEGSKLGPLVSAVQRDRVVDLIKTGVAEGGELIAGGPTTPKGMDKGFFVQPTVIGKVQPDSTLAQQEVFGPVLSILTYSDEQEAIKIANNTIYGLGGGVWAGTDDEAERVARKLRTGQVDINGGFFNLNAPFGGYKQSGNGRENGRYGLEEFLEYKALNLKP